MTKIKEMDHPLILHKLAYLRDENTGNKQFRELVQEISTLMTYEVTRDLKLEDYQVKTPMSIADCKILTGKKQAVVPILRAGLGMVEGVLKIIPYAKVGHIGLYRDPDSLKPISYYYKMPVDIAERDVIIVDPMLATGGSAIATIEKLRENTSKSIKLMILIASKEGIDAVRKACPDVDIYVGSIDDELNSKGYIVPGLGDAGDRLFGSK